MHLFPHRKLYIICSPHRFTLNWKKPTNYPSSTRECARATGSAHSAAVSNTQQDVYVGNLAGSVSDEVLHQFFTRLCSNVVRAKVVKNEDGTTRRKV